jgi:RNA polymerase sigma-70 factor (ECF subfamily)
MSNVLRFRQRGTARLDDDDALRAAYDEHGGELFGFAYRSLHDAGLAEEAVQETFVRGWRSADRFDPARGSLRTWLFAICRNVVVDLSRARSIRPAMADRGPTDHAAPDDDLERALMTSVIEEALQQDSERHRQVVVEVHLRGRPIAEVARDLGVPPGTVHSRLYYGLKALGVVLEEMGWLDER